jgi:hypothetical protein
VFWSLKQNNSPLRLLYPTKLSFKIDGEIRTFQKHKFMNTNPAL